MIQEINNKEKLNYPTIPPKCKVNTQKFREIPKQQRQNYINKIILIEPSTSLPPVIFQSPFQKAGKFVYNEYSLHYYSRQNTQHPKAIVIHFHGMSSHGAPSGYFSSVVTTINKSINFYALDQMNFGQSEGPYRGLVSSLQQSALHGEAFVDFLLRKCTQRPKIFLSGSSYGGAIIFKMIINKPQWYAGAIFLNPALRNMPNNYYLRKMGQCLGWILPRVRIPLPESSSKAHKYDNSQRIRNDPFYYNGGLVPGAVRNVLIGIDEVSTSFKLLQAPYIIFQGGMDKMVDLFGPLDLEEESPSKDKTTVYFQNLWHSVFNEEEIQAISLLAADWLEKRI